MADCSRIILGPEYTRTVKQRLELNAYPWLGKLTISSISTPMLVENLQRIIKRGARETARRVAQSYKQIFEFAKATGEENCLKVPMAPQRPAVLWLKAFDYLVSAQAA